MFFQGEWYSTCQLYFRNPSEENAAVVCRELGYEGAVATNTRIRNQTIQVHLLWYSISCNGNEDTLFECRSYYDLFYEGYYFLYINYCLLIPEYTCQSK